MKCQLKSDITTVHETRVQLCPAKADKGGFTSRINDNSRSQRNFVGHEKSPKVVSQEKSSKAQLKKQGLEWSW